MSGLLQPLDRVDRYTVLRLIARGGMGAVFAARLEGAGGFHKLLALKVMHAHLAADPNMVNMFLDEARLAAQLQHPNLPQVFDSGEFRGRPYLVMELLRGQPLDACATRAREREGALRFDFAAAVLHGAAVGLHAAHETRGPTGASLGLVHRDVSPQNVHVGYDGHVKVVDFGIARAAERLAQTREGEFKGKLGFASPEQILQEPVDRRADLWSLGVVAWQLLAGRKLFSAANERDLLLAVLNAPVPSVREFNPEVPPEVDALLQQTLERAPERRIASAEQFARVLEPWARQWDPSRISESMGRWFDFERMEEETHLAAAARQPVATTPVATTPVQVASKSPRWRWALVAAVAAVAAMGAWGVISLASPPAVAAPTEPEGPGTQPAPLATVVEPRPPSPIAPEVAQVPPEQPPASPPNRADAQRPRRPAAFSSKRGPAASAPAQPQPSPTADTVPTPLLESPYR